MSVNVDLLRRTLAHIEQHPVGWDQGNWRCDTGMCFAGWAATLAGGKWASDTPDSLWFEYLAAEPTDPPDDRFPTANYGEVVTVSGRARRILGLKNFQANELFLDAETLDDLRRIVGELCDGAQ